MKSNKFSKFIIFAMTVAILLFSLLFFITRTNDWRQKASALPQTAMGLVASLARVPYDWSVDTVNQFQSLLNTYQENLELKQTIVSLESQADLIAELEKDNESLRQQLKIEEDFKPASSIQTSLLSRSSVSWLDFAQVDKGSNAGVEEKMLLVSADGVLGLVSQVSPFSSQVELLTNSSRQDTLAVKIKTDKEIIYGILSGYDVKKGAAIVSQLNKQVDVSAGVQVSTSGLDGFAQENLPIGKVLSTEKDKDQSRTIYVTLSANLEEAAGLSLVGR